MAKREEVTVSFEGCVEQIGDRRIVRLPAEASERLPSRGQVAAEIAVAAGSASGEPKVSVIEPDGRRGHWIPLDTADADAGSTVVVRLTTVGDWPEPEVPDDLSAALGEAQDLAETWAGLTPMARWEWVRWVGATKNPATRERRVEVTIDKMRGGKRRPCCFDLSSCTDPEVAKSGKLVEAPSR